MPDRFDRTEADRGQAVRNLDMWAFTSLRAKREFEQEGRIDEVKKDIIEAVLEGGEWSDQDRRFLDEVARLVKQGCSRKKGAFGIAVPTRQPTGL